MKPEPGEIVAGDSAQWNVTLADHPAPDWVLHYALFNKTANISFEATADGADHLVTLTAATTVAWAPGRYDWAAYVTNGDERETVATGVIIIKADPSLGVNRDDRSHARKMLEAIEATLEGKATSQDAELVKGQYGERAIERDPDMLRKWRDRYRKEVKAEDDLVAMKAGKRVPRSTKIKFT